MACVKTCDTVWVTNRCCLNVGDKNWFPTTVSLILNIVVIKNTEEARSDQFTHIQTNSIELCEFSGWLSRGRSGALKPHRRRVFQPVLMWASLIKCIRSGCQDHKITAMCCV